MLETIKSRGLGIDQKTRVARKKPNTIKANQRSERKTCRESRPRTPRCRVRSSKDRTSKCRQREIVTKREEIVHPEIVVTQSFVIAVHRGKEKRREQRSSTRSPSPQFVSQLLQDFIVLAHGPEMRTRCHKRVGPATQRPEPLISRSL